MGIGLGNNLGLGIAFALKDMFTQNAVKISNSMDGLAKQSDELAERVEKAKQKMYGGMKMMAAGGAVVAAFVPAISASMEFGRAMGEVSTLVDTNTVNMDALGNSLLNLSTKYGQMPVEQTRALYNVISTGYTEIADANRILEASNKAAIAGVTDVNTAFEASVAIMKPYGMGVNQINDAYDKLFQTVNLGITKMPELSASMSQVTPIAQAVGISIDELLASISSMTVTTKASTSEIATQMSALASGILEGAGKQALIKKKYGLEIDMSSVALKNKGMVNFLGDITKQLNTLDAVSRDMALSDIFGRREAILAYMTLTGAGAKAFSEHLDKIKNSAGATELAFQKMSQTVGFQFDRMKASAMAMLIRIGQAVEPLVASILSIFSKLTSAISGVIQAFPKLTSFVAQFVFSVGGILAIGGAVVTFLGAVQLALPLIASGLTAVGITATATFSGIWAAIAPVAIPLAAITAGIILLKMAWDRNFLGMRTTIMKIVEPIRFLISTIFSAWKTLQNGIIQIDEGTANKLKQSGLFGVFKNIMMIAFRVKSYIAGVFWGISEAIAPTLITLKVSMKSIWNSMKPVADAIKLIFTTLTGAGTGGSIDTFKAIGYTIGFVFVKINPLIWILKTIAFGFRLIAYTVDFVTGAIEGLGTYIYLIGSSSTKAINWLQGVFENAFTWMFNTASQVTKAISGFFEIAFNWVIVKTKSFVLWFTNSITDGLSFLYEILTAPFVYMWEMVSNIFGNLVSLITAPFSAISETIANAMSGILPMLQEIGNGILDLVLSPLKSVAGIWDSITGFFTGNKTPESNLGITAGIQQATQLPIMPQYYTPAFAGGYSDNPMAYISQDRQISPMLPTSVQIEKSQILRENTYREKTNTIEQGKSGNSLLHPQVIKLEVDGRTLAQVVNDTNKREAVRRL